MAEYDITDIDKARKQGVRKHNNIIQKNRFSLSSLEQKIVLYLISKIKPDDGEFTWYEFSIVDFCKVCEIDYDNGKNYENVKRAIQTLRDRSMWITMADGEEVTISWINKAKVNKRSGKIKIRLDDDLKPYLLGVSKNFTQYQLLSVLPMRSQYSIRLYEFLKSYTGMKQPIFFDLEQLKKSLMCENYQRYPDFKRYVLDYAHREINGFTDIEISYKPLKTGKKITHMEFTVMKRDAWGQLFAEQRAIEDLAGLSKGIKGQMSIYDLEGSKRQ